LVLSPAGSINHGFILREDLLLCSSYLPLRVPNWAVIYTPSFSEPMASSKPPSIAEVDPVTHGKKLMTTDVGEPMMTSDGVSTVAGGGRSMATSDADDSMPIAGGESMATGDADELMMTSEGVSESVDPDPVIPTVGAN
jgi:hypothetical protein